MQTYIDGVAKVIDNQDELRPLARDYHRVYLVEMQAASRRRW
jgi:hypothetical protein